VATARRVQNFRTRVLPDRHSERFSAHMMKIGDLSYRLIVRLYRDKIAKNGDL
jgi:hypothetical protein